MLTSPSLHVCNTHNILFKECHGNIVKTCLIFGKSQRCVFQIHLDGVITTCVYLTKLSSLPRRQKIIIFCNMHLLPNVNIFNYNFRLTKHNNIFRYQIYLPCARDVQPKSSCSDFWFFHLDKFQPGEGNIKTWKSHSLEEAQIFITSSNRSSLRYGVPLHTNRSTIHATVSQQSLQMFRRRQVSKQQLTATHPNNTPKQPTLHNVLFVQYLFLATERGGTWSHIS